MLSSGKDVGMEPQNIIYTLLPRSELLGFKVGVSPPVSFTSSASSNPSREARPAPASYLLILLVSPIELEVLYISQQKSTYNDIHLSGWAHLLIKAYMGYVVMKKQF